MTESTANGTAWGEGSKQAHSEYPDPAPEDKPTNWSKRHTDADEIRRKFGIAPFDPSQFDALNKPYPNCIVHEPPNESEWGHVGGTNFLAVGEKGSGKSTLGLYTAERLLEINNEAVVWRGSSSRSEWLPLKHWTTLLLPRGADIEAAWKPRDIRQSNAGDEAELSDIVREVKYYDDPIDLNNKLEPGKFHVVYPDPTFAGCESIMSNSDFCPQPLPFVPAAEVTPDEQATPLVHWWFAWMVAKLEHGPYDWTTLIFDEAADLAPDDARSDDAETYEKVQALRRVMADSRKFYFSLFFFAHHEANLHSKIRRTVQWRINMADETANPCRANGDRPPVGYNAIPMEQDQLSFRDVGHGLFWTEQRFTRFRWDDMPVDSEDANRWLKISLSEPGRKDTRAHGSDQRADTRGAADD